MKYCAMCKRAFKKNSGSFFQLPKDERRRDLWNKACGRILRESAMICSNHFLSTDIYFGGKISRLMPNAVPVLNIEKSPRAPPVKTKNKSNCQKEIQPVSNIKAECGSSNESKIIELVNGENYEDNIYSENEEEEFEDYAVVTDIRRVIDGGADSASNNENLQDESNVVKCGFVTFTKGFEKNYYLCCFYCEEIFPIYKWEEFCDHVAEIHYELDDAEQSIYLDDYKQEIYPHNFDTSSNKAPDPSIDFTSCNSYSNMELDPSEYSTLPSEITELTEANTLSNQSSNKKKTNKQSYNKENSESFDELNPSIEHNYSQQTQNTNSAPKSNDEDRTKTECNEIRFGKTQSSIVTDFLQRLKRFPCLWFGESMDTYDAALVDVMNEMNSHWGLKLNKLILRNNLECIKRYYNSVLENHKQHDSYYPKYKEYLKICAEIPNENDGETSNNKDPTKAFVLPIPPFVPPRFTGKREKSFVCTLCDKAFHFEGRYQAHVQLHSEEIRKYKCDICDRHYLTENMLRTHKKRHDPPKFVCSICSKSYSYAVNFEVHMKSHSDVFDYVCEWCGKGFIDKKGYLTHVKYKHNSEGHCNICNHSCQTAAALDKHLKTYHRPLTIDQDFKRVLTPQTVKRYKEDKRKKKRTGRYKWALDSATGKLRVHCTDCEKSYLSYETLYAHIAKVHGYEAVRQSYTPNQIRKPNPGYFKKRNTKDTKVTEQNVLVLNPNPLEDASFSDSEIIEYDCGSTSDISTNKTETLITNTQVKYDVADYQELDAEYEYLMSDDVEFQL